jgi:hypothetical protein
MTAETSVIQAIRDWFATYASLTTGSPVLVDFLGSKPDQYSVVPMPGKQTVWDVDYKNSERTYSFAIQSMLYTADDLTRITNGEFFEDLSDWLDSQTLAGSLPSLPTGKSAVQVIAETQGFIYSEGQSSTGIYQISCVLEYDQVG